MRTALIDLSTACVPNGGVEDPDRSRNCYHFPAAAEALKAIVALGLEINLPPAFLGRPTVLLRSRLDGGLFVWVRRLSGDPVLPGWMAAGDKWSRAFDLVIPRPEFTKPVPIRYTTAGRWQVQNDDGTWPNRSLCIARSALHDPAFSGHIQDILADCRRNPVDPS